MAQVSDNNPEMLRYLGEIGIYPNVQLHILDRAPFDGPLHIRVNGIEHHIGVAVSDNIMVVV